MILHIYFFVIILLSCYLFTFLAELNIGASLRSDSALGNKMSKWHHKLPKRPFLFDDVVLWEVGGLDVCITMLSGVIWSPFLGQVLLALAFRSSCPCELKFLSHHLERARKSIGLSPGPGSYTPREESPQPSTWCCCRFASLGWFSVPSIQDSIPLRKRRKKGEKIHVSQALAQYWVILSFLQKYQKFD